MKKTSKAMDSSHEPALPGTPRVQLNKAGIPHDQQRHMERKVDPIPNRGSTNKPN